MCIIIKKLENNRNWMYLWGKYVTGVNLGFHCAKSLEGYYSKKIYKDKASESDIKLDEYNSNIFYLCGVSKPYKWNENFHLALRYKEGNNIVINRNGLYLEIENAEELPIIFDINKCNHKNKHNKNFATCRNWQFANIYKDLFKEAE